MTDVTFDEIFDQMLARVRKSPCDKPMSLQSLEAAQATPLGSPEREHLAGCLYCLNMYAELLAVLQNYMHR